ncbi:acyclic terpene utilization AtuA family protein [Mesorhizobium australicum]|nr:acyclic terpene utilization AtuA family protein [Mesorhizobium australicum]
MAAPSGRAIRIGCGAGFSNDRIEPARDLAERGELDFLFFECLAERTLAHSHLARRRNPSAGYIPMLRKRLEATLPGCRAARTQIITNAGAANPAGAAECAADVARQLGMTGLRIAVVEGDDVLDLLEPATPLLEGGRLGDHTGEPICANAYLGANVIADALDAEADIVIAGRVADPSLVLGPLIHAHGWSQSDWERLGAGTLVGHLLECSTQVTGGYFADPGVKEVSNLAFVGFPIAEVSPTGAATITKLNGTGGCVTRSTVIEQLFYEMHDPSAYLTPDVSADFTRVAITDRGNDRVDVSNAAGRRAPDNYKVTIGFDGGFFAESEIGYAGHGAANRARYAAEILCERMAVLHGIRDMRIDLIGVASQHATARPDDCNADGRDVRMRAALRTSDKDLAEALLMEMETLWIAGPAGGGGVRGRVLPSIVTRSALVPRERVKPRFTMMVS